MTESVSVGQRVSWRTVNGTASGIVTGVEVFKAAFRTKKVEFAGWRVRLDSGKEMVVNHSSVL